MAKITPKFDFSSSEPAYTPTLIQHNTTPVPHNALKPAIFNEYERVMLTLANAIGDLVELTNVLPNSPQDIASIIRALMDKYADKVTTRSLEVTGSASIGAMRLEWKNNQQYYVGDIIVYEKKLYRCKEQHKAENMPFTYYISKWELIGGGGSTSIDVTMPAHGFRVGEVLCYYNTYIKAKANNRDTIGLFVVSKVADEDNFTIMQGGYFKLDNGTNLQGIIEGGASYFTPNTLYYLSPTITGGITATEPYISQPVIFAISETEGYVLCQRPQNVSIPLSDEFTYNPGQQSYNLSYQPATNSNLLVIIDNYILPSTSYSINNNTITLTDTYDDTTKIRVVYYATHAYNPAASLKEYKFTTNNPTGPGNYVLEEAPIAKQYLIVSLNGEILDSGDYELISNVFTLNIPSQDDVLRILVILESRVVAPDLLGISDNTIPGEKILQGSIMPSKLHPDILALPMCYVRMNADQDISANVWTKMQFSNKILDPYNNFNTNTFNFVAPSPGYYFVTACFAISYPTSSSYTRRITIAKNDDLITHSAANDGNVGMTAGATCDVILYLNTNEHVSAYVLVNSSTKILAAHCGFAVMRIR